jgi:hypothetical protein
MNSQEFRTVEKIIATSGDMDLKVIRNTVNKELKKRGLD